MGLILSKSVPVGREALRTLTPPAKGRHIISSSYTPIPHGTLADLVEAELASNNLTVKSQTHGLYKEGQRYFGLYELAMPDVSEFGLALGLRNGYDGMIPAGIVIGSHVFVCDNLAFHGEEKIARRHTGMIMRDLPTMVHEAMGAILNKKLHIAERIASYKQFDMVDSMANDLILRAAVEFDVLPVTRAPKVWKQWVAPNHQEFQPRNMWSLHNAFTEVMKMSNTEDNIIQSTNLHNLLDNFVKGVRLPVEAKAIAA